MILYYPGREGGEKRLNAVNVNYVSSTLSYNTPLNVLLIELGVLRNLPPWIHFITLSSFDPETEYIMPLKYELGFLYTMMNS